MIFWRTCQVTGHQIIRSQVVRYLEGIVSFSDGARRSSGACRRFEVFKITKSVIDLQVAFLRWDLHLGGRCWSEQDICTCAQTEIWRRLDNSDPRETCSRPINHQFQSIPINALPRPCFDELSDMIQSRHTQGQGQRLSCS